MRIIIEKEHCFYIQFDFNKRINNAIMKLPDVQYDSKYKRWECPVHYRNQVMSFGERHGFELPEKKSVRRVFDQPIGEMPKLNKEIKLNLTPYDYQKEGIAYGIEKGSVINGDACGLGKTGQSIATIIAQNLFPCLIICPASLKLNWEQEWLLWTSDHKPLILTDSVKHTWPVFNQMGMFDVFIVNYESLKKYFVVNTEVPPGEKFSVKYVNFHPNINLFKSCVVDECHRIKEPSSQQSKLTYGITRGKINLLLSGTPVVNKPVDLLTQLMIVDKIHHFGGVKGFKEMAADNERWPEINHILRSNCYFRREKRNVLKDLPDLYRQKVYCTLTNQDEYDAGMADLAIYLKEWKQATDSQIARSMRGKVMVQMGVLKNISARGKLADVAEYINDVVDSGEKLIAFVYLHEVVDKLKESYSTALYFTGKESEQQRNSAVHNFQRCVVCDKRYERHSDSDHDFEPSEHQLIFVNYAAGGVGITLTAASRIAHIELPWTPKDVEQDEGRAHRISQKNAVQDVFFIGKGTIDEYIYQIIADKREMSNIVTGAEDLTEESVMDSIIELLMKGK